MNLLESGFAVLRILFKSMYDLWIWQRVHLLYVRICLCLYIGQFSCIGSLNIWI